MLNRQDLNQLTKCIVDEATGEKEKAPAPQKDADAIARGKVRAEKLTPEQKEEIAKKASLKRWG